MYEYASSADSSGGVACPAGAQGELPEGQEKVPWGDNSVAPFLPVIPEGTCEFRRLIQFILVGAVYNNVLTNCAARLCRALRG